MKRNPHADIQAHNHSARYFTGFDWYDEPQWVIVDRERRVVARVKASVTRPKDPRTGRWYAVATLEPILVLDEYRHELTPLLRPGGLRTALRWFMCRLNNGKIYLSARLALMTRARELGFSESTIVACWHASDRVQCIRLCKLIGGQKCIRLD